MSRSLHPGPGWCGAGLVAKLPPARPQTAPCHSGALPQAQLSALRNAQYLEFLERKREHEEETALRLAELQQKIHVEKAERQREEVLMHATSCVVKIA